MKNKNMKYLPILLMTFLTVGLSSCKLNNSSTTVPPDPIIETKSKLTLKPNEKYLLKTETPKKVISLKKEANDVVDFQFSIEETDLDSFNLKNPNDLIIGRERILLQPVAINYLLDDNGYITDQEAGRLTVEETEANFTPIIEMSSSGYGDDDISLDAYEYPQIRTCYAISSSANVIQSQYYDVSITIQDVTGPVAIQDVLSLYPDISYKTPKDSDGENLTYEILSNYVDNSNSQLYITYYKDNTYQETTTIEEELAKIRSSQDLISNNKIQAKPLFFKVSDSYGNSSNNGLAYVTLNDDVAPILQDLEGNQVTSGFTFIDGPRYYYPDFDEDLVAQFKERFQIYDEVDGILTFEQANLKYNYQYNGATFKFSDLSENLTSLSEECLISDTDIDLIKGVWYPSGASATSHPERGLKYTLYTDYETGETVARIHGPNIEGIDYEQGTSSMDADVESWMGTDGLGHIQIPQFIELYGHNYKVVSIDDEAFYMTKCTALSATSDFQENVYDFSGTYLNYIGESGFTQAGMDLSEDLFFIMDTLNENGLNIGAVAFEEFYKDNCFSYITKNIKNIEASAFRSFGGIYLEYSEEEVSELESGKYDSKFYCDPDNNAFWYGTVLSLAPRYYSYTLEQFKTEFGLN